MEYDYTALAGDPDGYLNWVLGQLGAALSIRTASAAEADWVSQATELVGALPDPMTRARLASTCSLRQLRVLVRDEHLAVRLSCVDNPFAIDRDIQVALCGDHEVEVVRAFLDRFEPCFEAAQVLVDHPRPSIRARLASPRRRRELLDRLATDTDWTVKELAKDARRHQIAVASAQFGQLHRDN